MTPDEWAILFQKSPKSRQAALSTDRPPALNHPAPAATAPADGAEGQLLASDGAARQCFQRKLQKLRGDFGTLGMGRKDQHHAGFLTAAVTQDAKDPVVKIPCTVNIPRLIGDVKFLNKVIGTAQTGLLTHPFEPLVTAGNFRTSFSRQTQRR